MRDEVEISESGVKSPSVEEEDAEEREKDERESEKLVAFELFGEVGGRGCHTGKKGMF